MGRMLYAALFAFCWFSVGWLVPTGMAEDRMALSKAVAHVVAEEPPLFKDDDSRVKTASLVLAIAYREGSLRARVVGDCTESKPGQPCKGKPRSYCTMQIHVTSGGSEALNDEPEACIRAGLGLLRTSLRVCPEHPVAWYAAGGNEACDNERAQRISRDRMTMAKAILRRAEGHE